MKILESTCALRKNDYILFIYPSVTNVFNRYTKVKRYGYYSVDSGYMFKFIAGSYVLLDTKNRKVVGCWHGVENDLSPIITRSLYQDEKAELYKYVTDGLKNQDRVKLYQSLIFDGEISDADRKIIIKVYSSDNSFDEDVDDELHNIRMMLRPLHHTPETYASLPDKEKKRLDDGMFEVQQSFVNEILRNFD